VERNLRTAWRIIRVCFVAAALLILDYSIHLPTDAGSLTCMSIGQLAAVVAVFIDDVHPPELQEGAE
jgi:hypothetical protein